MTLQPRTTFTREPYTVYLYQLLDEMRQGELLLPRFQRPLVWDAEQRLDLMNSILRGLPIGAVMLWDTSRDDVAAWELVGPHKITTQDRMPRKYVLDGTQRLTSLLAALTEAKNMTDEQRAEWWFGLDLEEDVFERWNISAAETGSLFPSSYLLSHDGLVEWRLKHPNISSNLFSAAKEAVKSFLQYKVAVIPVATNDLSAAAEVLYTVNSRGTQMSTLHMVHAKLTGQGVDLLQYVQRAREHLTISGWGKLPDEDIVRVAQLHIGLDASDQDVDRLSNRLKTALGDAPTLLNDAARGLSRAAYLLQQRCLVATPDLLPYGIQAVLLGAALVDHEPSNEQAEQLSDWVWLTTYWSTLFGRPQVRPVYKYLLGLLRGKQIAWPQRKQTIYEPLPPTLKAFSARVKALALRLALLKPRTATGELFEAPLRLADAKGDALGRLITRWPDGTDDDVMQEDAGIVEPNQRPSLSSAGNRILSPPGGLDALRELLLQQPENCSEEVRRSHHITHNAWRHLIAGDHASFIRQRSRDLTELEEEACKEAQQRLFNDLYCSARHSAPPSSGYAARTGKVSS